MPIAVTKLVAMLLLVVQGAIALAPGRVLCIPVRDCGTHQPDIVAACDHCDSHGSSNAPGVPGGLGEEHGPFSAAMHPDDECGCHLHVPVPDSEQVPSTPRGDNSDLRNILLPRFVAFVFMWEFEPSLVVVERFKPLDVSVSDQVLALKSTRLLI